MASRSQQPPPPPPPKPQAPRSRTTILSLGDDLLCEIFLRLPSLPEPSPRRTRLPRLPRRRPLLPAFRRSFVALHPPPLLGFFFDYGPSATARTPDLAAAVRFADVFLTCVPGGDDASPGWRIDECRGGFLLLTNGNTEQVAVYNPLSRALDLFPVAPGEMSDGCRGKCTRPPIVPSGVRLHDKSRVRAAVFSSGHQGVANPPLPSGKKYWLRHGRQANGKLYWSHTKQAYKVVLDTATMQFSFMICRST
ncbi:hypothetical protein HU200_058272 [Digitaria exilis]|uniref:Uncharacterized protein n=1 Tax=Digitaria exilis TaxID=1010633 RepID=A0A835ACX2_9POAL|nr:hypothetical protein HU200_058272 [Digitaria exilis]